MDFLALGTMQTNVYYKFSLIWLFYITSTLCLNIFRIYDAKKKQI